MTSTLSKTDVVAEIRVHHETFINGLKDCVESALEIGRLLNEQKAVMAHGQFLPWLERNITFISSRTCRRWMQLDSNRSKLASVSNLSDAYKLLEVPKTDQVEDDDVIDGSVDTGIFAVPDNHVPTREETAKVFGIAVADLVKAEEVMRHCSAEVVRAVEGGTMTLDEALASRHDDEESPTPFEAKSQIDEKELTGDSFNLQQLKHFWKRASKADRGAFREWISA